MYNNPYFRPNEQPIQNIFTNQLPFNDLFLARYLKENEKVEEIYVQHKTAFIDTFKRELKVKELNGNITTYKLVLPLDEKDQKIEELQKQINELKGKIENEQSNATNVSTSDESTEQNTNVKKSIRK